MAEIAPCVLFMQTEAQEAMTLTKTPLATRFGRTTQDERFRDGTMPLTPNQLRRLTLRELEPRCLRESAAFRAGTAADGRYGFELLRRALAEQSEAAWEVVLRVYGRQIVRWVRAHPSFIFSIEEEAYYVNRAFERLWRSIALKPQKFARFHDLPAILRFLKLCVHSAVLDDGPATTAAEAMVPLHDVADGDLPDTTIDLYPSRTDDFWAHIDAHLQNEQERIAVYGYFYYGLKNRELLALFPKAFRDSKQLANLRITVLRRLARVPEFEDVLRDMVDDPPVSATFVTC